MATLRERLDQDLEIRGYSLNTRKVYVPCVKAFVDFFGAPPGKLGPEHIREYQLYLIQERGRRLPEILSQEEVAAMLAVTNSLRDRAILMALYGGGLRLGEVQNLRTGDIDSGRMVLRIVQGKGRKDPYVRLPDTLLRELRAYWKVHRPAGPLLFPGNNPNGLLCSATIQRFVRNAARKAGITKRITPHSLRHAYATHHLEQGTNLREIQLLLGHASLNSTTMYTHVARNSVAAASSPLDGFSSQKRQVPKRN